MKKTLNVTVSKTLMVCLNPGITGEIAQTKRKGLSAVFKNNNNYTYIWSLIKQTLWWSRNIHLSLLHYPNLINKFIGRQRLTVTTEIQKSQKLSETNKETFFMEGKVRNLKLKLKKLILWRTANSYRISFKVLHLNVSVTSKKHPARMVVQDHHLWH